MVNIPKLPLVAAAAVAAVSAPRSASGLVQSPQFTPTKDPNMNGEYMSGRTPGQGAANYSTTFSEYPGGVEYFEVYAGPITTLYSQVFWAPLPEVEVPADLVARFKGKGMAIVGFEGDQVRRTADGDVSVPINMAYNHHYGVMLLGSGSSMEYVPRNSSDARTLHPGPTPGFAYLPVEHTPTESGLPTSAVLGYSNGGEYRKTYHGLASPYAQLVESPTHLSVTPMQIDTWHRDEMNISGGSPFVPGPMPRNSLAPPNASYSGLLECPLTTRIRKHFTGGGWNASTSAEIYQCPLKSPTEQCPLGAPTKAQDCFAAVKALPNTVAGGVTSIFNSQGSRADLPPGCSLSLNSTAGTGLAFFNTNNESTVCCGQGVTTVSGTSPAWTDGQVSVALELSEDVSKQGNGTAIITLRGPADGNWFGVAFDTTSMSNAPYAIVVDGTDVGNVTEHVLGNHLPGVVLPPSVEVISNTVADGVRTVTLRRALVGASPEYHTFDPRKLTLDIIEAVGSTPTLAYHRVKTVSQVSLWPSIGSAGVDGFENVSSAPVCVCSVPALPFGKGEGTLEYLPTGEVIGFPPRCNPTESILQNHNPTCDIRTYVGGLSTCHHMWSLLDADQDIPWPDQPITYFLKWRIYFQEYDPAHHVRAYDVTWSIGGDTGEYDVPQCAPGTPVEQCTHEITGTFVPPDSDMHFVAAHYHCHAPTCLSLEIRYDNETGPLICKESPYHGQGHDLLKYGLEGNGTDRFDEEGYIALPICLWGPPPLEPPPLISGKKLWVRAVTNNTYGHHGEMALPQMLVAEF